MAFKSISEALYKFGEQTFKLLTDEVEKQKLVGTRNLSQSIDFNVKILGNEFVWTLVMADYWKWVDEGRNSGKMPPIEPLINWLRAKGIRADLSKRRKRMIKSLKNRRVKKSLRQISQEKAQRQMAWGIAKNISKKGTIKRFGYSGSNFYSNIVTPQYLESFREKVRHSFKNDVQIQIKEIFEEIKK